jgi:ketosteroid isomerase-like protein
MAASRRSLLLTATAAGLASLGLAKAMRDAARAHEESAMTKDDMANELLRLSAASNAALLRGDIARYRALITLTDDFTLMSPFGGMPTRSEDMTEASWEAMGRFFSNGALEQELVQYYACADIVVLAIVEHGHGEVGGLPAQNWPLRVTLVYRREDAGWRLAHRHADPLVNGISLNHAAALARGEVR